MKRRTEHLVEKRDGRREFLRATKLARSVHLALYEIGVDEDWRALELAGVVLEGLRQKRKSAQAAAVGQSGSGVGGPVVLTTAEIADSVQHLLVVTGQPTAAVAYGAVQAERARRRQIVGAAIGGGKAASAKSDSDLVRKNIASAKPAGAGKSAGAGKPAGALRTGGHKPTNRIWGEG